MADIQIWPGPSAYDVVGLLGSVLVVIVYFLNQRGSLRSDNWVFPGANLVGAGLITISLYFEPNLPSLVIEAFWIAISLYGLVRALRS